MVVEPPFLLFQSCTVSLSGGWSSRFSGQIRGEARWVAGTGQRMDRKVREGRRRAWMRRRWGVPGRKAYRPDDGGKGQSSKRGPIPSSLSLADHMGSLQPIRQ